MDNIERVFEEIPRTEEFWNQFINRTITIFYTQKNILIPRDRDPTIMSKGILLRYIIDNGLKGQGKYVRVIYLKKLSHIGDLFYGTDLIKKMYLMDKNEDTLFKLQCEDRRRR